MIAKDQSEGNHRTYSHIILQANYISDVLINTDNVINPPYRIKSRVKRTDDENLVTATAKGDYHYWLSQEDIADIARIEYNNFQGRITGIHAEFEVIGSLAQLRMQTESFKIKAQLLGVDARLTCLVNLGNWHWVSLVISYEHGNVIAYYIDSKDYPMPVEYSELFWEHFRIQPLSLATGSPQQTDAYNCGLWALENAASLNELLDFNETINWVMFRFKFPRDKNHFTDKRRLLAEKLRVDSVWRNRHPVFPQGPFLPPIDSEIPPPINPMWTERQKKPVLPLSFASTSAQDETDDNPKRAKLQKNPRELREVFVKAFIAAFLERLGAYHLAAKGKMLTPAELKAELTKGVTGSLIGLGLAQSVVGMIPSLAASTRELGSKYYLPNKAKSQRITKVFSKTSPDHLSRSLAEAAVAIFNSFESQFMQVTDKAGDTVAMEKLAEDAMGCALNYIEQNSDESTVISKELLEKGILQGPSERFFDPGFSPVRLRTSGNTLQDENGHEVRTAYLYKKVGLRIVGIGLRASRFYKNKELADGNCYGYRRLLSWEKAEQGGLTARLSEDYQEEHFPQEQETAFQYNSRRYNYVLDAEEVLPVAQAILNAIQTRFPVVEKMPDLRAKASVLFNLAEPIHSFTGRVAALQQLHRLLSVEKTTAIVPALSTLTLQPTDLNKRSGSTSPVSVSGLGGIGKTQLALRYAKLYAVDYDHNVLWINAETKENIDASFRRLATKLDLRTKDRYSQDIDLVDLVAEVYAYFSDRKSLFIFDNVENYRAIEAYLPKVILDIKPTLLITSRYSYWEEISSVLSLDVFTEQESIELIKNLLNLSDNTQDAKIKELNQLLQGLPLALQQALAYIKLQRKADGHFSLHDYVELYKAKRNEVLSFDFSRYSNDPYLKTVFTTWQMTLDKIRSDPEIGADAIEILTIMAYLNPDNISYSLFYYLDSKQVYMEPGRLASIMHLLRSYSMVSDGSQEFSYAIHRLVQQVIRVNLNNDQDQFEAIIKKTEKLLLKYDFTEANDFHLLHFLLYMSEYIDIKALLLTGETSKVLFHRILFKDISYWTYFLELAHLNFTKEKFLNFIGGALIFYIKNTAFLFLFNTLMYIEAKWKEGTLSKENIKYILQYLRHKNNPEYKVNLLSRVPEKRERQRKVLRFIDLFRDRIFENEILYDICPALDSKKRSINNPCLSLIDEKVLKKQKEIALNSHLNKVRQVSRWINSGLMTKNTLSDLLQGDFASVAINVGLIASSVLSEKVSNKLLIRGEVLAAEDIDATLLEKELTLENEKALTLLLDEEVLSVAKRRFLGKILQVASPFVRRGTSIFFAYTFAKELKAYQRGNTSLLPELISNGVIVTVDGLEAGIEAAEFLEVVTGISQVTGPVGEAVAALIWLGMEAYEAHQQVNQIEKFIQLSRSEEFLQELRAFFHFEPSTYLEVTIDNQLLQKAIEFLKIHPEIQSYVFPTFRAEAVLHSNSGVFLDKKRELVVDTDNPIAPREGRLFCVSGAFKDSIEAEKIAWRPMARWSLAPSKSASSCTYLCQHAIGVEYPLNRTANLTFISLAQGYDKAIAATSSPTLFLLEGGHKVFQGSDRDDLFIVAAGNSSVTGLLQGNNGIDTLILDNHYASQRTLLMDQSGFLCEKSKDPFTGCAGYGLKLDGINRLYGRSNRQEVIYLDRSISFIDGRGGKDKEPDFFWLTQASAKKLQIILRDKTSVLTTLNAKMEFIDYKIPANETGEAWVQFHFPTGNHRFFFEYSVEEIKAITTDSPVKFYFLTHAARYSEEKIFQLVLTDPWSALHLTRKNVTKFPATISYFFQGIEIKLLSEHQIYAQEIEDKNKQTLDDKIRLFVKLANRLGRSFSIRLINNATIVIGQNKQEVFYINTLAESHIIGKGGENVYILMLGNDTIFPVPPVTFYHVWKESVDDTIERVDTLDLRELIKKIKQLCPTIQVIIPSLLTSGNDVIITLNSPFYYPIHHCISLSRGQALATIRLKNALSDNHGWYQKLDILLEDTIPRNIILNDDESLSLAEMPLVVPDNKKIVLFTAKDLSKQSEILLLHDLGNYSFYRNEDDLLISNVFNNPADVWTLIFYHYYQNRVMQEKVLSARLTCFDGELHLRDRAHEINQAAHFSQANEHVEVTESPLLPVRRSHPFVPIVENNDWLTSNRRRTQQHFPLRQRMPQSSWRTKRQVNIIRDRSNQFNFFKEPIVERIKQRSDIAHPSLKYQVTAYENSFLVKWFLYFFGYSSLVERMNQVERVSQDNMSDSDWAEQHLQTGITQYN